MQKFEIDKKLFRKYSIKPEWFKHNPYSIHGILHEYRVLVLASILAAWEKADSESICFAAIFHDVRRNNDGFDKKHADRASKWVKQFKLKTIDEIEYLIKWHTPSDKDIPELTLNLKCFKDADALDRWRIGDLDPNYLRTESARKLLNFSRQLFELTNAQKEKIMNPKRNILKALKDLNALK